MWARSRTRTPSPRAVSRRLRRASRAGSRIRLVLSGYNNQKRGLHVRSQRNGPLGALGEVKNGAAGEHGEGKNLHVRQHRYLPQTHRLFPIHTGHCGARQPRLSRAGGEGGGGGGEEGARGGGGGETRGTTAEWARLAGGWCHSGVGGSDLRGESGLGSGDGWGRGLPWEREQP